MMRTAISTAVGVVLFWPMWILFVWAFTGPLSVIEDVINAIANGVGGI